MSYVEVPYERLSSEALQGLIEEFVTRDGTDYGERETPLDERKAAVLKRLQRDEAVIVFDEETQSATIVLREQLEK